VDILRLSTTTSTQDVARHLPLGSAVVSDHQVAGRGRLDRRWEAPPGSALLASFVLPHHPLASLAAGVAAAAATSPLVRLKWPNDLILEGGKLGGILVESDQNRCLVGIGINLTWAPPGGAMLPLGRDQLLERLGGELERWLESRPELVLEAWRAISITLGQWVRVDLGRLGMREGLAQDVDSDGALLVAGQRVWSGDVVHLRPGPDQPWPAESGQER